MGAEPAPDRPLRTDVLVPAVHRELRSLAHRHMLSERSDHTLQTTALINEAYLRLAEAGVTWQSQAHFLAVAATAMRRILIDHAKGRNRGKRGGRHPHVPIDDVIIGSPESLESVLLIDEALTRLEAFDERKSRLLELHCFAGLDYEESARVLGISVATVGRELRIARAWLKRELAAERPCEPA
ncbi:MAG: sigma-70 family RNA polymerase sigma factor [Gammaproteobacteria bacterium]|nr:sigma-70 family RNA polymerase sigma factor [Gammaproteobacteria bacterium]